LLALCGSFESCAVAVSAGVDSAVVAKAAYLALGDRAVAVTAVGPSLAEGELEQARHVAEVIGIAHHALPTEEINNDAYRRNAPDRCYHCKDELYSKLAPLAVQLGVEVLVNGANADDTGDYRPGMAAASDHRVRSPLAECKITKAEVRQLARQWKLPVWDKPAMPCLASRVAYGEEVTPERLSQIDRAEQILRELGLEECRVRYHRGDLARIEVPVSELARLVEEATRSSLAARFRDLGFKCITLDLEGFRSGNLNQLVSLTEQYQR